MNVGDLYFYTSGYPDETRILFRTFDGVVHEISHVEENVAGMLVLVESEFAVGEQP